jgi:hypothetical protein
VADVAGRALRAAVDRALGDDPAADAGADLDEQEVALRAPVRPVLADGHDVHVVVDEDRHVEAPREAAGDRVAVPAGHDRRVDGPAGGELDRARNADADAPHLVRLAPGARQELRELRLDDAEHRVGARADVEVLGQLGERVAGEVHHREARVGGAEVGAEHDRAIAREDEAGGGPAAGRGQLGRLADEPAFDEPVDALADRRAAHAGEPGEIGPRDRCPLTDQREERPGAGAGEGGLLGHAWSLAEPKPGA